MSGQIHAPGRFIPGERIPGTHKRGAGWASEPVRKCAVLNIRLWRFKINKLLNVGMNKKISVLLTGLSISYNFSVNIPPKRKWNHGIHWSANYNVVLSRFTNYVFYQIPCKPKTTIRI